MSTDSRLASFKHLLEHARVSLGIDSVFALWDGATVPADLDPGALTIAIADEGAVAGPWRRPTIDTIANLWASAHLDIRNGTTFDLVARRRIRRFVT